MRLEPVVVSRVADRPVPAGQSGEVVECNGIIRKKGLLDQNMLPMFEEIREKRNLGCVRRADERRVIRIEGDVFQPAIGCLRNDRIDRGDDAWPGVGLALPALNAEADDDHLHANWTRFSTALIFSTT